jgi:histidinol-phosphate aminotransferase
MSGITLDIQGSNPERKMLVNPNIEGQKPYKLPALENIDFKLDIVENLFPQPKEVLESIGKSHINLESYPCDKDLEVLDALVKKYVNTDLPIIFTHGSDNALKLIVDTFFTLRSIVGILKPNYPHFIHIAEMTHSRIVYINCSNPDNLNLNEIRGYHLIYMSSPSLPWGYVVSLEIIKELARNNQIIVVDEAYFEYGSSSRESAIQLIHDFPNIIVTRTFSKYFGLASLRLGYIVSSPKINELLQVGHNGKDVCKISVNVATVALQHLSHYEETYQEFLKVKEYLRYNLNLLGVEHILKYGNFFTILVDNPKYVCETFQKNRIAVRDKSSEIEGAIRISICPLFIMKRVIGILQMCLGFRNKDTWIFDLDQSLRKHSKLTSEVYSGSIKLLNNPNWITKIITNNFVDSISDIQKQLSFNGEIIRAIIPENVVLAHEAKLQDLDNENVKGVCIEKNVLDTSTEQWAIVSKLLGRTKLLCSIEKNMTSTLSMMGETNFYGNEELPDCGMFIDVFMKTIPDLKHYIIGKPNLSINVDPETSILVGDSETDYQQAKNLSIDFIKVGSSNYAFPFYNGDYYEIRNVDALSEFLQL